MVAGIYGSLLLVVNERSWFLMEEDFKSDKWWRNSKKQFQFSKRPWKLRYVSSNTDGTFHYTLSSLLPTFIFYKPCSVQYSTNVVCAFVLSWVICAEVMWSYKYRHFLFLVYLIYSSGSGGCDAISNTQFNASIREYAVAEDSVCILIPVFARGFARGFCFDTENWTQNLPMSHPRLISKSCLCSYQNSSKLVLW